MINSIKSFAFKSVKPISGYALASECRHCFDAVAAPFHGLIDFSAVLKQLGDMPDLQSAGLYLYTIMFFSSLLGLTVLMVEMAGDVRQQLTAAAKARAERPVSGKSDATSA
ncbi:hypothetical protein [Asticcacaulis sp.]|uniref:hypothetical protein n=1 Tax=Asticcacaulis sp. TaxID=1872648 RepID=UPI002CC9D0FD|nr:hypothetical protein [Asticcacaulis sp.]HTM81905.1 hypothetical protein [Asticcacaulis sp.]